MGEAETGREAIAGIDEAGPDVVVVDYMMPGLDGHATAKKIRARRPDQASSSTPLPGSRRRTGGVRGGIAFCVDKSQELTALERAIRRLAGELF